MRQISMRVSHNIPEVKGWAKWIFKDQLPYVLKTAINETAKGFQRLQMEHMARTFTVRRPGFVLRSVKIKPFATKTRLYADVQIDPPGGQARADILTKFEDQTVKTPFSGRSIAIPTSNVPTTGSGIISKKWRPGELFANATQHGQGRAIGTKGNVFLGKHKTILIKKPGGRGVILERDYDDLITLYVLRPRVRIKPDLHFQRNARQTVTRDFEKHFTRVWNQALRTARKR